MAKPSPAIHHETTPALPNHRTGTTMALCHARKGNAVTLAGSSSLAKEKHGPFSSPTKSTWRSSRSHGSSTPIKQARPHRTCRSSAIPLHPCPSVKSLVPRFLTTDYRHGPGYRKGFEDGFIRFSLVGAAARSCRWRTGARRPRGRGPAGLVLGESGRSARRCAGGCRRAG